MHVWWNRSIVSCSITVFTCDQKLHYTVFNIITKHNSPDKCFLDESSLNFLSVSEELPSMTTKRHIKQKNKHADKNYLEHVTLSHVVQKTARWNNDRIMFHDKKFVYNWDKVDRNFDRTHSHPLKTPRGTANRVNVPIRHVWVGSKIAVGDNVLLRRCLFGELIRLWLLVLLQLTLWVELAVFLSL